MKILALDPSSTRSGYAVAAGPKGSDILDAGVFTPDDAGAAPEARGYNMALAALETAKEHGVSVIVMEVPAPTAYGGQHGNRGQAIYGMAVGVFYGVLRSMLPREVRIITIAADKWKRGQQKTHYMAVARWEVPGYDSTKDKGGDCADALGLVWWYYATNKAAA